MGKPTHKNKYIHIVQNTINQIYLHRNYNVTTICKKKKKAHCPPPQVPYHLFPYGGAHSEDSPTAWLTQTEENYNYYRKFYKNLPKKNTTSPLASILKTGSFEKAGWQK